MPTGDTSHNRLMQRRRELALANFHIYNPTQSIQTPTMGGVTPVSVYVTSHNGILPWVYDTPGGTVSQSNPVAAVQATVPDAPILVSATGANVSIILSWTAPPDSGSAITDYRYTTDTGATKTYKTLGTTDTTATITTLSSSSATLVNGTSYTVSIIAVNSIGTSIASAPRTAIPITTVSTSPTLVSATAGDGTIALAWTAPTSDGGAAITSYKYTTNGGTNYKPLNTTTSPETITTNSAGANLVNGTPYTIAIVAVNIRGDSAASNTRTATPAAAPGAPTLDSATGGDQSITLAWTAPASNGGSAITNYTYTTNGGTNYRSLGLISPATITTDSTGSPLLNGTGYPITIKAVNAIDSSIASNLVSATPSSSSLTVPGPPTAVSATAGGGSITLAWTAPSATGGSAITDYRYSTDAGTTKTYVSLATTGTRAMITRDSAGTALATGTPYTVFIVAVNAQGNSVASIPAPATPTSPMVIAINIVADSTVGRTVRPTLGWLAGQSVVIDWGDGTTPDSWSAGQATHTYTSGQVGPQTLTIKGRANAFTGIFNSTGNRHVIVSVDTFLDSLTLLNNLFATQTGIFTVPTYLPPNVTNISVMFQNSPLFNQPLNTWDTSNVTNMSSMFRAATSFNQPLSSWNTSKVTNMVTMFFGATTFNQPLAKDGDKWNTAAVTDMGGTFANALAFNQDLTSWDIRNVGGASGIFNNAPLMVPAKWPIFVNSTQGIPNPADDPTYYTG